MDDQNSFFNHLDFLAADLLSLFTAFTLAYRLHFGDFSFINSTVWKGLLFFILMVDFIITLFLSPYSGIFRRSYYREIGYAAQLTIYNLLTTGVILYLMKMGVYFSRVTLVLTYSFYFNLSLLFKFILWNLHNSYRSQNPPALFIVAKSGNVSEVLANVSASDFQLYDISGVYLTDGEAELPAKIPLIRDQFADYILQNNINDVLIAISPDELETCTYEQLVKNGVTIYFDINAITDFHAEEEFVQSIGITRTLGIGNYVFTARQSAYLHLKRLLDILISFIGCILLLPICGIVKFLNHRNSDDAPIFYMQNRIGFNGKHIRIFKFRSMVPNAEEILQKLLEDEKYRAEWEASQKLSNDPRITKVGKILRKTSLDELPQLINVLRGEMSLVGPRPLVRGELESHNGLKLYQKVKPGITGWWGCNGRSNISYQERLELEYYYVKNISLGLDLLCIFRTLFFVLKREGAQ